MNMDGPQRETILEEESNEDDDLKNQLKTAKEEIQSLTQQLNCLLLLAKNAWRGDETATIHLARVIGINPDEEPNMFIEKKPTPLPRTSPKKTVTISNNHDEPYPKVTPSISSSSSQETLQAQEDTDVQPIPTVVKNNYLQPFLQQSHIDPIRGQKPRQIFNNMIRYHQSEARKPPPPTTPVAPSRNTSATVRPRATKHLYRPASAEHVVRHLGSPMSRRKPYFVFAGREFFQQTNNYAPLYQRALVTSAGSRQSQHSDFSDQSDVLASGSIDPIPQRPQSSKPAQQNSMIRFGTRSIVSDEPAPGRISSAVSSSSRSRVTQMSERERRDAMRLQRQLNLPRQGWLNQQHA